MPISLDIKNSSFKGVAYKLGYRKSGDKDDTYVENITIL